MAAIARAADELLMNMTTAGRPIDIADGRQTCQLADPVEHGPLDFGERNSVLGTQTKAANSTANQTTEITNSHESPTPLLISVSVMGPYPPTRRR
jgi:hypothetical protein